MARVLTLANEKGGVGKSTSAVNLAVGFGRKGYTTLLVDFDMQRDATFSMFQGYPAPTVVDRFAGKPLDDCIHQTDEENVWMVPADEDLAGLANDLEEQGRGFQLELKHRVVDPIGDSADIIVIDPPPSTGPLSVNAIAAADSVYVPLVVRIFGVKAINSLKNSIDTLRSNFDEVDCRLKGIFISHEKRTKNEEDGWELVGENYPGKRMNTIIPQNVRIDEAHSRDHSIYDHRTASGTKPAGAVAYEQLVDEVLEREGLK